MTMLTAYAKVNLSLRVGPLDHTGRHPLRSLAQSIEVADTLRLEAAEKDEFVVLPEKSVPADESNLAWRAIQAVRAGARRPLSVHLEKGIPVSAGLGGGSADAAAALVAAGGILGVGRDRISNLAPSLGSDVPFCLVGGRLWFEGYGEILSPAEMATDFTLAVAVPQFELSTAAVYRRWDEMEGPEGPAVAGRDLPPSLRDHGPLVNDLIASAIDLRSELGDWRADLRQIWGRPVLMSGSGPSQFAFFSDLEEAGEAVAAVVGARAAMAAAPVDRGWDGNPGGDLPPPPWEVTR
jgi:4-diphosphocytidyl-2C-methyl-D-erythritol kinase